jgi:diguanylate cyclase (GGDEF)-like protein/PAS domain S-box-containing protein
MGNLGKITAKLKEKFKNLQEPGQNFADEKAVVESGSSEQDGNVKSQKILEQAQIIQELEESHRKISHILESITDAFIAFDNDWRYTYVNSKVEELLGRKRDELLGKVVWEEYPHIIGSDLYHKYHEAVRTQKMVAFEQYSPLTNKWLLVRVYPTKEGLAVYSTDITERREADSLLRSSEERYRAFVEQSSEAIWRFELEQPLSPLLSFEEQINHIYRYCYLAECNDAMAKMYGFESAKDIVGTRLNDLMPRDNVNNIEYLRSFIQAGYRLSNAESEELDKNGNLKVFSNNLTGITENGMLVRAWGTQRDITEKRVTEQQMKHQALHDALTGLPNRKALEERLDLAINMARRHQQKVAVMFLDLDRFKNVNDTLGHLVGDILLKEVASRFTSCLRQEDTVARLGGDEFIVLLPELDSTKDAVKVAEKLLKCMESPIVIGQNTLHISTSIGIAVYPTDGQDPQMLLKNADTALFRAKEAGRNRMQLYNQGMNAQNSERFTLEHELREALVNKDFVLHYQPIVNVKTNRVIAAEALLRWKHPKLGLVYPNEFIPLMEELGLISQLGCWVLRQACVQAKQWQEAGLFPFSVAVNLSPQQFSETKLVADIAQVLAETGLPGEYLEVEITETVAMSNIDRTRNKLRELKNMGVHITLDDFGTGYSSLSYLKSFPIDNVKIDKSFVRHSITSQQDAAIIRTIISMAYNLNLKVIAEGVETDQQLRYLAGMNCQRVQGYLIHKPMPAAQFNQWLEQQPSFNLVK